MPQLWENYRSKSADGISLAFLVVWFIGDLCNFFGSVWASLVPTVVALAIYFCLSDAILITQCCYYNFLNARKNAAEHPAAHGTHPNDPSQPLLRRLSNENIGLPGSRRRSSASHKRRDSSLHGSMPTIPEEDSTARATIKNIFAILAICVIGTAGWAVAWKLEIWVPTPTGEDNPEASRILGAEILGYLSAVAYLG